MTKKVFSKISEVLVGTECTSSSTRGSSNTQQNKGTRNVVPPEPMKLSDARSTMKCGISEEVRLMELEAGDGVKFPVLGASS